MSNPLVKKGLIDAVVELRADVEKELQTNPYYMALTKLDELLAVIKPLGVIEGAAKPIESPKPEVKTSLAEAKGEEVRSWAGAVKESVQWPPRGESAQG
jgi:hypothetical protein